jgi:thymidylate synthase (FAD)
MKIKVVDPKVWMLTSRDEARRQLARCAFAAGLSRGRLDIYSSYGFQEGTPSTCEADRDDFGRDTVVKSFAEAEALVGRLLAIEPYPHETVIEHSGVSFLFRMSRIASHEIVRHRLAAITQQSTRYCESGKDGSVTFIRPLDRPETDCGEYSYDDRYKPESIVAAAAPSWVMDAERSIDGYREAIKYGRKREFARYQLPHCIEVWLQMTANFREWRHIIRLRTSKAAAPEMRMLFEQVKTGLKHISPVLVEGL